MTMIHSSDRLSALLLLVLCSATAASSCSREPIYDEVSKYRFEFSLPEQVLWCEPGEPELIQVLFYDPETGRKVDETYMSPAGGYLYSVEPGNWNIVAYTMGSTRTQIDYDRDFALLTAHTSLIQSSPLRVVNGPDHIFECTLPGQYIPQLSEADEPFVLNIPLRPLCDSWRVEVSGIEGLNYASSVSLLVFNQAGEVRLSDMGRSEWCAIRATGSVQGSLAVIPFCTFGMPTEGSVSIRVVIEAEDGQKHSHDFDVTAQIRSPLKRDHVIRVDYPVELLPLIQGGLDPSADEWEGHRETIDID